MTRKPTLLPQAEELVSFLKAHPESSISEIQADLRAHFAKVSHIPVVIGYVRNIVGDEVLTCHYNETRGTWTYKLSTSAKETHDYVVDRKIKVRNECQNLVGILDRSAARYPSDPDIRMARAMLASVVMVMDAGAGGGTSV